MKFNNAIAKSLILLLAATAISACGDDDDKSKPDDGSHKPTNQDQNKPIPKLEHLTEFTKFDQPAPSKVLSKDNPAAKIADGVDKDALAKSKAITVANTGDILQYQGESVNDVNKGILLKDDSLFKLVAGLGRSQVHGAEAKAVHFVYNTPYVSLNTRYRESSVGDALYGTYRTMAINGMFTTPEQMSTLQKAGGKANFEGLAMFQKDRGKIGYGKLDYSIDLAKLEGSGKITGLEGLRDFKVDKDGKASKPEVGMWFPDVKEIELGAVSFAKPFQSNLFNGKFNGGEGKVNFKGHTDTDNIKYQVAAVGPRLESVAGSITFIGHGNATNGAIPFFGMRNDMKQ